MDLSLPARAPEIELYREEPTKFLPFALYLLVDLNETEIQEVLDACNSQAVDNNSDDGVVSNNVRLPPEARYIGGPLRAAFDYHVRFSRDRTFDPSYWLAVVSRDWRKDGVLVVNLDDYESDSIDTFMIRADESGLALINLQISNVDWAEVKENHEIDLNPGSDSGGTDDDDGGGDGNDGDDGPGEVSGADDEDSEFKDDAPHKKPPAGYYIGIYTIDGVEFENVLRVLQPAYGIQPHDNYICRFQGKLKSNSDLLEEACKLHPRRCAANKYLHKAVFIIVDSLEPRENGLVLALLEWDGQVSGKSQKELSHVGETAGRKQQRIICEMTKSIPLVCSIASGGRKWEYKHWCFAVYMLADLEEFRVLQLVDKRWLRRKDGEERVFAGPNVRVRRVGGVITSLDDPWTEMVRKHPSTCYHERFKQNFHRQLFICCDHEEPGKKGILLVHMDWDGVCSNVEQTEATTELLKQKTTCCRCPTDQVYQTLSDIADGKTTWETVTRSLQSDSAG